MNKIPLKIAQQIAYRLGNLMAPHCLRVELAGSVRRKKPEVSDIEMVVHPKKYWVGVDLPQQDIFQPSKSQAHRSELVDHCLMKLPNTTWIKTGFKDSSNLIKQHGKEVLKAVPGMALDLDVALSPEKNFGVDRKHWKGLTWYKDIPVKLDIFLAGSDNFGAIHFIRTGSKEFNLKMIAALKKKGYGFEDGYLVHLAGSKHDNGKALGFDRQEFCYEESMIFEKAGMAYIEPKNRG
ncbi:MAG: hypothetical protein RIC57_03465 [Balneola sp.]